MTSQANEVGADLGAVEGLMSPDYGRFVGTVLPAVAEALGADVPGGALARAVLGLPRAARTCVVLVDGLGYENLAERVGHAPFLRSVLSGTDPLSVGFPSTTATSLGSFGTGLPPGTTGMVGYTARDPRSGRLVNLVSWEGAPPPREWQPSGTVFERLGRAGVEVVSVGPARFAGSGLTEATLRGGGYRGVERPEQRVAAVLDALRTARLVYLYWGEMDRVGHHHGCESWQWGEELSRLDAALAGLARSLPRGTALVVTADHGMVDVDPAARWDVPRTAALAEGVVLVAGEPRALHLHLAPGVDPEEVRLRWELELGDAAVVATRAEAVAAGWFGAVTARVLPVLGDVVVAMRGRATVVDSRTQTSASMQLLGVHGSATSREMQVPLLVLPA